MYRLLSLVLTGVGIRGTQAVMPEEGSSGSAQSGLLDASILVSVLYCFLSLSNVQRDLWIQVHGTRTWSGKEDI